MQKTTRSQTHLDIASPTIQIQMQVLDFAKLGELILEILLGRFFMNIGDEYDPPFDGCANVSEGKGEWVYDVQRAARVSALSLVSTRS